MWASSDTFSVGDGFVRARYGSADAAVIVRAALASRLVDDRDELPVTYAIRLEPPTVGVQPLHVLYEDSRVVRRSRDPVRVVRALVDDVNARDEAPDDGMLHVAGCAAVGPRGAVVLPLSIEPDIAQVERRLNRAGLAIVEMPFLTFDTITGELVVSAPTAIDTSIIDRTDLYKRRDPADPPVGRHRVSGWLVDGRVGGEPREPILQLVLNQGAVPRERAWQLAGRMIEAALVLSRWHPWPDDLVSACVRLAEGRR